MNSLRRSLLTGLVTIGKQKWYLPIVGIFLRIIVPLWLSFSGKYYVEGENLIAGSYVFMGVAFFIVYMKAVHESHWFAVGMRLAVAILLFISGMYLEMSDYTFGIGAAVVGFLAYIFFFKFDRQFLLDANVKLEDQLGLADGGTGAVESGSEDTSSDDESESPE